MKTILYLIRHSGPHIKTNILKTDNEFQVTNEKYILSIEGEEKAKLLSEMDEFKDADYLVSSHYVRAVETAKYITDKTGLALNIDSNFGERRVGIKRYEDMPDGYYSKQKEDSTYKIGDGENQIEVTERMTVAINNIINKYVGKKIVVVTHSTAISFFLLNWCKFVKKDDLYLLEYNGNIIIDRKMNSPEVLKLIFSDLELENIEVITPKILLKNK